MTTIFRRLVHATTSQAATIRMVAPRHCNRRWRNSSIAPPKIGHARTVNVGTAFAESAATAISKLEGLDRMPITGLGMHRLIGGTLLALACGGMSVALAQPASPPAASSFTGTYTGTTHLAGQPPQVVAANGPMQSEGAAGDAARCALGGPVTLQVQDGRFRLPWSGPQAFDVRIAPDGSFYATSGNALAQSDKHMMLVPTMQGRVSGASLVADYGTRWCHYRLEATRS